VTRRLQPPRMRRGNRRRPDSAADAAWRSLKPAPPPLGCAGSPLVEPASIWPSPRGFDVTWAYCILYATYGADNDVWTTAISIAVCSALRANTLKSDWKSAKSSCHLIPVSAFEKSFIEVLKVLIPTRCPISVVNLIAYQLTSSNTYNSLTPEFRIPPETLALGNKGSQLF